MGNYRIPTNWDDKALKYVVNLAHRLNSRGNEDYTYQTEWICCFLQRLQDNKINPPFTYDDYCSNNDIIATIEGYGLNIEQFWFALLFIFDITMDFSSHAADISKADYEVLTEINDYLQQHPQAWLYLSDDKALLKKNRYETNAPIIMENLRRYVKQEVAKYKEPPQEKWSQLGALQDNYTAGLNSSLQQVLMYKLYHVLFITLNLPDLRAAAGGTVSYSKTLLVSRIIYFCRLTRNESFLSGDSSLRGILKQYGDFDFNTRSTKYYTEGLTLWEKKGE